MRTTPPRRGQGPPRASGATWTVWVVAGSLPGAAGDAKRRTSREVSRERRHRLTAPDSVASRCRGRAHGVGREETRPVSGRLGRVERGAQPADSNDPRGVRRPRVAGLHRLRRRLRHRGRSRPRHARGGHLGRPCARRRRGRSARARARDGLQRRLTGPRHGHPKPGGPRCHGRRRRRQRQRRRLRVLNRAGRRGPRDRRHGRRRRVRAPRQRRHLRRPLRPGYRGAVDGDGQRHRCRDRERHLDGGTARGGRGRAGAAGHAERVARSLVDAATSGALSDAGARSPDRLPYTEPRFAGPGPIDGSPPTEPAPTPGPGMPAGPPCSDCVVFASVPAGPGDATVFPTDANGSHIADAPTPAGPAWTAGESSRGRAVGPSTSTWHGPDGPRPAGSTLRGPLRAASGGADPLRLRCQRDPSLQRSPVRR